MQTKFHLIKEKFLRGAHQKPNLRDAVILSVFVILITFQPFFLHGRLNEFEVGLYLPGINAVLHGLVPFRDFFHLRGPFEIYMPAGMMAIFGTQLSVLSLYFYVGTIITMVVGVLIAKELYRTRYLLYLMALVFTARTFPRVVYHCWGGMRYAFGMLALFCAVRFFKRDKLVWIFLAGTATACGLFTSVEIGVCAGTGIFAALLFSTIFKVQDRRLVVKAAGAYAAGILFVVVPYVIYLIMAGAFLPYIDAVYSVVTRMEYIINQHNVSEFPSTLWESLPAMFNPESKNFRHLTPAYFYIVLGCYFLQRVKRKKVSRVDVSLMCVGAYGFVTYAIAFRGIWAAQFEMALQPEKILFFYILEETYLFLKDKKGKILQKVKIYFPVRRETLKNHMQLYGILFLLFGLFGSSVGYSIDRYNKRFTFFKVVRNFILGKDIDSLKPLAGQVPTRLLNIERGKGMVVPVEQAEEFEAITAFIQERTRKNDIVFMYPELPIYSFLVDRPFLGRFPIATFSWFQDRWHQEFLAEFKKTKPQYVILPKKFPPNWEAVYLTLKANKEKYDDVMNVIKEDYFLETSTPKSYVYKKKRP